MIAMSLRSVVAATGALIALGPVTLPARQDPTRTDATSMQRKLAAIVARGEVKAPAHAMPVRTSFTDREVNAYFKVFGPDVMPDGVVDPQLVIDEGGRVRARALVDLQAAVKPQQRTWLDPLAWVPPGKLEMIAAGTLLAADGTGRLSVDTASIGGVAISKSLLQQLVSYYSRSAEQPQGFNLDQPFALPANIRTVETRRGAATVVQ
jgi:hypothetical protein